jgi:hypothetical protein
LSCGIPIKLIIQISYIQFDFIQIGLVQIIDYESVTKTILKLAGKSTLWESTIKILIADNQNSLLDISLVARGEWSVTPDGTTKQPTHYPPGSCYMFDPDLYGENSWEKLKGMLTIDGCVSGCSVVVRDSCQQKTIKRKANYLFCCSHGLLVEEKSLIEYGDNVGPSNVIKEHLKHLKTTGHSKKGKKRNMCTTCLLNQECMYSICNLPILTEPNCIFFYLYNLILFKGTKGMAPKKKKAEIKKKKALEHKHRMKRKDVWRCVSK